MINKILYAGFTKKSTEKSVISEIQDATDICITNPDEVDIDIDFPRKFKITLIVEDISIAA